MNPAFLAVAGMMLAATSPSWAAPPAAKAKTATSAAKAKKATPSAKSKKKKASIAKPADAAAAQKVAVPVLMSTQATRVAQWVGSAKDNHALPYIIIDKQGAHAFLFDAAGKPLADAPVLIGIAPGDDATPGIGAKSLSEIGPAEKTTPAGRFLAKFGVAAGKQRVLWVDYATSVALHTIPPGNPKEKRTQRMLSPVIDDNRITFGCINVPKLFYNQKVSPLFRKKGGYVYILPDSKPIEEVFPRLRVQPFLNATTNAAEG